MEVCADGEQPMMKELLVKQRSPAPPLNPAEPDSNIRILRNKTVFCMCIDKFRQINKR